MLAAAAPAASAQAPGEHSLSGNFLAGEHARAMSDHAAAANYLSAVLAKNPDNEDLLQANLAALVHEGRFAEALPIAQRLEKQGSRHRWRSCCCWRWTDSSKATTPRRSP